MKLCTCTAESHTVQERTSWLGFQRHSCEPRHSDTEQGRNDTALERKGLTFSCRQCCSTVKLDISRGQEGRVTSGGSQLVRIGKGRARQVRNSVLLFELHYSSLHLQLGTEEQFVFTVDIFLGSETITYTQNKGNNHKCDL